MPDAAITADVMVGYHACTYLLFYARLLFYVLTKSLSDSVTSSQLLACLLSNSLSL